MSLRAKFNLAIITALLIGYAGAGFLLHSLFVANARAAVLENAEVMMSAANAMQAYIDQQIVPVAGFESNGNFLTANVPFYAARTMFAGVRAQFPDYALAEVALNPTNPSDRPEDWQADIINAFRNDPSLTQFTGVRNTITGTSLKPRSFSSTCIPSMSGRPRSSSTTSGPRAAARRSPSVAVSARSTS